MNSPKPTHMFASLWIGAVLFFAFVSQAGAQDILTNVTVDDASPSVQYLNGWSPGPSLYIQLDGSKLFNGTWHDTTHYAQDTHTKEMHVNFTGKNFPFLVDHQLLTLLRPIRRFCLCLLCHCEPAQREAVRRFRRLQISPR